MMNKKYFEKDHLNTEMIAYYTEKLKSGELNTVPGDVLRHVEECFDCKEAVLDVYTMMSTVPDMNKIPMEIPLQKNEMSAGKQGVRPFIYTLAIMVSFIGLIIFKQIDTTSNQMFTTDPMFEHYIESTYRSDMGLEIISPLIGETLHSEILSFQWNYEGDELLKITILNNEQNVVITTTGDSNGIQIEKSLSKGLYYWKLETDSNLLYVGKFIIE